MRLNKLQVWRAYRQAYAKAVGSGKDHAAAEESARKNVERTFGLPWATIITSIPQLLEFIKTLKELFKK